MPASRAYGAGVCSCKGDGQRVAAASRSDCRIDGRIWAGTICKVEVNSGRSPPTAGLRQAAPLQIQRPVRAGETSEWMEGASAGDCPTSLLERWSGGAV